MNPLVMNNEPKIKPMINGDSIEGKKNTDLNACLDFNPLLKRRANPKPITFLNTVVTKPKLMVLVIIAVSSGVVNIFLKLLNPINLATSPDNLIAFQLVRE